MLPDHVKKESLDDKKKNLAAVLVSFEPGLKVALQWKETPYGVRWQLSDGLPFNACTADDGTVERIKARLAALSEITNAEVRANWKKQAERLIASPGALSMDQVGWLLDIDAVPTRGTKGPYGGKAAAGFRLRLDGLPKSVLDRLLVHHPGATARTAELLSLSTAGALVGVAAGSGPVVKAPVVAAAAADSEVHTLNALLSNLLPQVVLHGPPGTGKTRLARLAALSPECARTPGIRTP